MKFNRDLFRAYITQWCKPGCAGVVVDAAEWAATQHARTLPDNVASLADNYAHAALADTAHSLAAPGAQKYYDHAAVLRMLRQAYNAGLHRRDVAAEIKAGNDQRNPQPEAYARVHHFSEVSDPTSWGEVDHVELTAADLAAIKASASPDPNALLQYVLGTGGTP